MFFTLADFEEEGGTDGLDGPNDPVSPSGIRRMMSASTRNVDRIVLEAELDRDAVERRVASEKARQANSLAEKLSISTIDKKKHSLEKESVR